MKLKKIASLALAGVMAVSMLTACGGNTVNGGDDTQTPDVTPTTTYTDTVMADTSALTQTLFKGQGNSKLDQMVAYVAANSKIESDYKNVMYNLDNLSVFAITGSVVGDSGKYMGNSIYMEYCDSQKEELWKLVPQIGCDRTVYTLLRAPRYFNDEKIDMMVADYMDNVAAHISGGMIAADDLGDYSYTVSIAKADSIVGNSADRTKDTVVIAVAWNVTYTPDSF